MKNYFEMLDKTIKEYFKILSDEIPDFLNEYINTKEMQKQSGISVSCGTYYTKLFDKMIWYSSLDHSIAVSLIVWNFTKDKKQTLAGLFHDIATPVFKHSIDFMNGDYEKQESTEELTTRIINESQEIMKLLKRDGIKVEEVDNYHIYPIADNDTPMLSADRLEYTLSNGLGVRKKVWNLNDIKEIYDNIEVQKNEQGIDELGFKDKIIAEKFVKGMRILSNSYIDNKTKLSMQFLADIMKNMSYKNLITKKDLYELSEKDANIITASKYLSDLFESAIKVCNNPKAVNNWIISDISRILNETETEPIAIPFDGNQLGKLVILIDKGTISSSIGKKVLTELFENPRDPEDIIKEKGWIQISDEGAIKEVVSKILEANPQSIADYKAGKDRALGFLVGQAMKETKGKANPKMLNEMFLAELNK